VAGDAVLIAPVSAQIPCKHGFNREILSFEALETNVEARNRCAAADFRTIP
jgi:hypothetical protein